MIKKIFTLLLCFIIVFSVTGTFVAVEGGDEQYQQEMFSLVEKNLITGEETTRTFDANEIEESLIGNEMINQFPNSGEGMITPYGIIGDDDMQIVEDTTLLPYSAIAFISVDWPGLKDSTRGTAFMISKNVAVTAGHNLYDEEYEVWANSVTVYPGKNGFGLNTNPFGSLSSYTISVSNEWKDNAEINYDWGLIVLDGEFGSDVDFLNYFTFPYDNSAMNMPITICGYPNTESVLTGYNQHISTGTISDLRPNIFFHNADTLPGSSGAPVLNAGGIVIGIHVDAHTDNLINYGLKISNLMIYYFSDTVSRYS